MSDWSLYQRSFFLSWTVQFLRPKGKWLSLVHQRYITGRELLALMGFPIHRMRCGVVEDSVAWLVYLYSCMRNNGHVSTSACLNSPQILHILDSQGFARLGRKQHECPGDYSGIGCCNLCNLAWQNGPALKANDGQKWLLSEWGENVFQCVSNSLQISILLIPLVLRCYALKFGAFGHVNK